MVVDSLEFHEAFEESRGKMIMGKLKFQTQGIFFKNAKTRKTEHISSSDIDTISWVLLSQGYGLRVLTQNGFLHRFCGFSDVDFEKIQSFTDNFYDKKLEKKEFCVKGYNWGEVNFFGSTLSLCKDKESLIEIPLNYVSQCMHGKNESTLEFVQDDDAPISLCEIRFHIPTPEGSVDTVKDFTKYVMSKANVIRAVGDAIVSFEDVQIITPRGRYLVKLYPTFFQLCGKSFDFKILYSSILRLFLLPDKYQRFMVLGIRLDPPLKHGQTRYPFIIFQFPKEEDEIEVKINTDAVQENKDQFKEKMSGQTYEVFSLLMKMLSNEKLTTTNYKGHDNSSCISCSYKAAVGSLYPLERSFVFIPKPSIVIRYSEIANVNFARGSGSTKSFDFEIFCKNGIEYFFCGILKGEYTKLFDFIKEKGLCVKNIGEKVDLNQKNDLDSDDEDDPYINKIKQENGSFSDSEDEDFKPTAQASDPDEEFYSGTAEESNDEDGDDSKDKSPKTVKSSSRVSNEEEEEGSDNNNEKTSSVSSDNSLSIEATKQPSKPAKTVSKEKSSKRRKKAEKDPNMPKRPLSSYFIWMKEERENIKKQNPGISVKEISRIGGELWKKLSDKSKWENMAKAGQKEYANQMRIYKSGGSSGQAKSSSPKCVQDSSVSDVSMDTNDD